MRIRQRDIDECITLSRSYLMQHDLRPRIRSISTLAVDENGCYFGCLFAKINFSITSGTVIFFTLQFCLL